MAHWPTQKKSYSATFDAHFFFKSCLKLEEKTIQTIYHKHYSTLMMKVRKSDDYQNIVEVFLT